LAFIGSSFIKPGKTAKVRAHAALKYEGTRPGKHGEEMARTLFGHDGPYTQEQTERMIDEAPANTYFFSFVISPDPNGEENANRKLNLEKLTRDLVKFLERRLNRPIEFIAAVQNDHTDIPHVHALALIQRQGREMLITPETLEDLRKLAAGKALKQQANLAKAKPLIAKLEQRQERAPQGRTRTASVRAAGRATRPASLCYHCGKPWNRYHECEEELELTRKLK
jgi:hypothetical protein